MNRIYTTFATVALVAFSATAAAAQSDGPSHPGYDPNASTEGHYHEGDLGEKLMVIESAIKCQCGCGLDVHSCQFQMQCGTSPVWSKQMRDALAAGQTVDAIQASFVAEFGPQVLMAPPPEGFNLLGYLLPGFAIVTAGMLVGLIARGGTRTGEVATVEAMSSEQEAKLAAAMKKMDELESPDW